MKTSFLYTAIFLVTISLLPLAQSFADRGLIVQKARKVNDNRTALVIGNSDYKESPLQNPVNDAKDMARVLKKNGFEVIQLVDADRKQMQQAINQFGKKLRAGGTGFFYYAGHGMQVEGRNYLIPVNAQIESESDVKYEAVDAGRVLGKMDDASNGLNIVIMDACRNNPFARSFRSSSKGLAKMDAPTGTLIAYATSPGSVAADGSGDNGIYTKYLLKHLNRPNLKIEDVFKNVRIDVVEDTGKKQVPWESSSLVGNFYFNIENVNISQINSSSSTRQKSSTADPELEYWNFISQSTRPEDFQNYLVSYPDGKYKKVAILKLRKYLNIEQNLLTGSWNAWNEESAISEYKKQKDGSIHWNYSVKNNPDGFTSGLFVSVDKKSFANKKIRINIESKNGLPIWLSIYSFVDQYSKNDDFDSMLMADKHIQLKPGKNELLINANELVITDWFDNNKDAPRNLKFNYNDIRGLEFNIDPNSPNGVPEDKLIIRALELANPK